MSTLSTYFRHFEHVSPPETRSLRKTSQYAWYLCAGATIGFSILYIHWRWTESLNPEYLTFSVLVATAETLIVLSTALFYYDIWTDPKAAKPHTSFLKEKCRSPCAVDIFITTFDEGLGVVSATVEDAKKINRPKDGEVKIFVLDDGRQAGVEDFCREAEVNYIARSGNIGYKAGNLKHAMLRTNGDFILILDADTRALPTILENTLHYFDDSRIAWVQTPHWFYDIPSKTKDIATKQSNNLRLFDVRRSIGVASSFLQIRSDPFLSKPELFFDVIQRRRDRNNASFCCGAGSIHRRSAILENSLLRKTGAMTVPDFQEAKKVCPVPLSHRRTSLFDLQPFAFHVSEDILTSIQLHKRGWHSKYHHCIEAKMLSPWSIQAWAMQKWKYSGGTIDIFCNSNPLFSRGMPFKTKVHYLSTFVSYISVIWLTVLLSAPIFGLVFGVSPISAYSLEFFIFVIPPLVFNEIAMYFGCRKYNTYVGRVSSIATIPIQILSAIQVISGRRIKFPATPKAPGQKPNYTVSFACISFLTLLLGICGWGIWSTVTRVSGYNFSMLFMNLFWMSFLIWIVFRVFLMAVWSPDAALQQLSSSKVN